MLLSVIVPCYNEEESIPLFFAEMQKIEERLPVDVEYLFIDDGSTDTTLHVLEELQQHYVQKVHYYSFSRNFGKEAALYAGLKHCKGDFITVMDVDLQDPPELLVQMYEKITTEQYDCIGCRRTTRQGESKIRSFFATLFYRLINAIGQTEMVNGARDFRLMTRQMVDSILELTEYNRFSKGLFTWVGYKTYYLEYENRERIAGETSWSFWKLFSYSIDGIINFSEVPLNLAAYIGTFSCIGSVIALFIILFKTLILGDPTQGWPSLVCIILFVSGLQLLSLGVIGKYIAKIFLETKKRPIYILKKWK